jgi:hypothetical protein
VIAFLEALALDRAMPRVEPDPTTGFDPPPVDSVPWDADQAFSAQPPMSSSGLYAKVCEDLWGMVAMLTSSVGALAGNDRLVMDGQVIDQDKRALGRAWGKLAETNETFRKMLASATSGGAWLEIALVTGTTASKIWAVHSAPAPSTQEGPSYGVSSADARETTPDEQFSAA